MLRVLFSLVCTAEDLIKAKTVASMRNYCQYYYSYLFPVSSILPFFLKMGQYSQATTLLQHSSESVNV